MTEAPGVRIERGPKGSMVPPAELRSYYDQPIIKAPVWTWEIPSYLFAGGAAGASAVLARAAERAGMPELARAARRTAMAGTVVSPLLLISDLGRPERFHHMLRVFKPTSPMNMGTWILTAFGPAAVGSAVLAEIDRLPRVRRLTGAVAAALGPMMATYTAVLYADTAVPVWHEARRELPMVFAGSAAASAAALAALQVPPAVGGPARRLAVAAALLEVGSTEVMQRRLGTLAQPLREGEAGRFSKLARGLTLGGAAVLGLFGRKRIGTAFGGAMVVAGSMCTRWAVFKAAFASAADPSYTVAPQRERMAARAREASISQP